MEVSIQVFMYMYAGCSGKIAYVRGLQEGESRMYVGCRKVNHSICMYGCSGHSRVCTWVAEG
jgi:hypothetical protein